MKRIIFITFFVWMAWFFFGSRVCANVKLPKKSCIDLTNAIRRKHQLPELKHDSALMRAAQKQANYMARHRMVSHFGVGHSDLTQRLCQQKFQGKTYGEVVGKNSSHHQHIVVLWMKSPPHRRILLNKKYKFMQKMNKLLIIHQSLI